MKVLYLIDSLASGGAQRQLVTLLAALDRETVVPHVAVYHPHDHFRPAIDRAGVPVHSLGASGAKDPRVLLKLIGLMRRERFHVVHSYLRTPGVLARVAAPLGGAPAVVVSHRSVDLGHSATRLFLERALASRARAFIANAEVVRECVETLVPGARGRVFVVPNGIAWSDPGDATSGEAARLRAQWAGAEPDLLLGVVGRVESPKDPHLLFDALVGLPADELARLSVVWVGAGTDHELKGSVEERVAALTPCPRFRFVGELRSIETVYLAIDCLVLPSRWEGFPNAVLEAQAHGVPVIATDVGDVREIVDDGVTGWIVPTEDPVALRAAVKRLIDTPPAERAEMGRRGTVVRDRYSADLLAARTVDVYRRVLGDPANATGARDPNDKQGAPS